MLTERQKEAYRFVREYHRQNGYSPKLTEIAEGLGIRSKGVVHRYLQAISNAGLIELVPGRHRGIRLLPADSNDSAPDFSLPLAGKIAAGHPIEAIPDEETINLADFFMGPERFVLKVQGDSMTEAGILDGDMVIVERRSRADDGDIVVALIDRGDATLKRIKNNRDGYVTLIPANPTMQPMIYASERVQIQGVVVGQMRSYSIGRRRGNDRR